MARKNFISMTDRTCTIGNHALTGFSSSETGVSIEYNEDQTTQDVGIGGDVAYAVNANKSATLTISLQETSPSNDYLAKILGQTLSMDSSANFGAVPFSVRENTQGSESHAADECVVKKYAKREFGNKVKTREWTVFVSKLRVTTADGITF